MPAKHQTERRRFVAPRSLHFSENGRDPWAHFKRDRAADSPEGVVGYSFETDDPAVIERLRGVDGYGIVEVEAKPAEPVQ